MSSNNEYVLSVVGRMKALGHAISPDESRFVGDQIEDDGFEGVFSTDEAAARLWVRLAKRRILRCEQRFDGSDDQKQRFPWIGPLSRLYAYLAEEDPEVVSTRDLLLGGHLLGWTDLESWIADRSAANPAASQELNESPPLILTYALPDTATAASTRISRDSDLTQLHRLAQTLAGYVGWHPAAATTWILTGVTPLVTPVRVTVNNRSTRRYGNRPTIDLRVDPDVTPKELARIYAQHRSTPFEVRRRSLARRTLDMVETAFSAGPEASWSSMVRDWNREHPDDQVNVQTFRRYVNRGIPHLLNSKARFGPDADEDGLAPV